MTLIKIIQEGKLKGNWHEIVKDNGTCDCSEEKGVCGDRLRFGIRSQQKALLEGVIEMCEKSKKHTDWSRKKDVLVQASEEVGFNTALDQIKSEVEKTIKVIEKP